MDIQKMLDAMMEQGRLTRGQYQMTLGGAIKALETMPPEADVVTDDVDYPFPGEVESYRGYYSDLAFVPDSAAHTAEVVLSDLKSALGETFEGYKGGDFVMQDNTPLWIAPYGQCPGIAVMDIEFKDGKVVFACKQID